MEEAKRRRGACTGGGQRHATDQRFHYCHYLLSTSTPQHIEPHYYPPLYPYHRHHFSLFTVPFLSMTAMASKRPEHFTNTPTFTVHDVIQIKVVHTYDLEEVTRNLDMYEKMLQGRKSDDRFMGLDLEYTSKGPNNDFAQLVAVLQLCLDNKVLVYEYSRYVKNPDIVICVRPTSSVFLCSFDFLVENSSVFLCFSCKIYSIFV